MYQVLTTVTTVSLTQLVTTRPQQFYNMMKALVQLDDNNFIISLLNSTISVLIQQEFKGNCDHVTPVLNILDTAIYARYVKFHPIKYYEGICMRVEIYGC